MTPDPHDGPASRVDAVRRAVATVPDPEIPVLSIADLGILRDVVMEDGEVVVCITPTYSGCPAMHVIQEEIVAAVDRAGLGPVTVRTVLSPAWSTDWITAHGREQLRAYGIAPPAPVAATGGAAPLPFFRSTPVACPRCGSTDTRELAAFGSTACKALWRCERCREPFDYFKAH